MVRIAITAVLFLAACPFPQVQAEEPIFVYEDEKGAVFFSDLPQHQGFQRYSKKTATPPQPPQAITASRY